MLAHSRPETVDSTVSVARPDDEQRVLDTLACAFASDPPCRWLYPDETQYLRNFPAFAMAFGGAAIRKGSALVSREGDGVALWLAPGSVPDEDALVRLIERSVPDHRRSDVFALFAEMSRQHPLEPHWYLPLIGVVPARQGLGMGAALLRPVLEVCDAAHLPAYLEATSPRSVPFYRRHGFEPVGEIRVSDCPPIVPMWRSPASC
jgi:GNAT superfamily N-acetyltransferase